MSIIHTDKGWNMTPREVDNSKTAVGHPPKTSWVLLYVTSPKGKHDPRFLCRFHAVRGRSSSSSSPTWTLCLWCGAGIASGFTSWRRLCQVNCNGTFAASRSPLVLPCGLQCPVSSFYRRPAYSCTLVHDELTGPQLESQDVSSDIYFHCVPSPSTVAFPGFFH